MNRRNYIKAVGVSAFTPAVTSSKTVLEKFIRRLPDTINGQEVRHRVYSSQARGNCVYAYLDGDDTQIHYSGEEQIEVESRRVTHSVYSIPEAVDFIKRISSKVTTNHIFIAIGQGTSVKLQWYGFGDNTLVNHLTESSEVGIERTSLSLNGVMEEFDSIAEKNEFAQKTIKTEVGWL